MISKAKGSGGGETMSIQRDGRIENVRFHAAKRRKKWNRAVFFENVVEPVLFLTMTIAGVYAVSALLMYHFF